MATKTQERVAKVLERIAQMAAADGDDAQMFSDALDIMLDELHCMDAFGTEGQCDPRGDFRNGTWSMCDVEGIDG